MERITNAVSHFFRSDPLAVQLQSYTTTIATIIVSVGFLFAHLKYFLTNSLNGKNHKCSALFCVPFSDPLAVQLQLSLIPENFINYIL